MSFKIAIRLQREDIDNWVSKSFQKFHNNNIVHLYGEYNALKR